MPAEVVEQLKILRDLLDELAPPVTIEDLSRIRSETRTAPEIVDVIHLSSPGLTLIRQHWPKRVVGMVAAVAAVVVGLAALGRQDVATSPGPSGGVQATADEPQSSTTLVSIESLGDVIPAGSSLRVTKELPGAGTVSLYDAPGGSQTCMVVNFDDGGTSGGCASQSDIDTGHVYSYTQHSHSRSDPALLLGVTATNIGFHATVNGTDVTPDDDGIWFALVPLGTSDFTISTNSGSTIVPIRNPETTPTFVVTMPGSVPP